jgi:hypothetical protein
MCSVLCTIVIFFVDVANLLMKRLKLFLCETSRSRFLSILLYCNGSRKNRASIMAQKAAGRRDAGRSRIQWEHFFYDRMGHPASP